MPNEFTLINKAQFHALYKTLNIASEELEDYFFEIFHNVNQELLNLFHNSLRLIIEQQSILEYLRDEYLFLNPSKDPIEAKKLLSNADFRKQLTKILTDKIVFCEMTPYHPVSLISESSPVISTIELYVNFILNRIDAIKKVNNEDNILINMFSKVFLMFKSLNYLLSNGFETEAFANWRTIHELECIIAIMANNPYLIPVYLQHIVYNNAFRNTFEDKDEQQRVIDDLKMHMKEHDLKSKDMKKYIEYGWLYSLKDIDSYPDFKLNFRNGLELIANLNRYSKDYEMSSEVAHSSPLLIFSNKKFFKELTLVRSYETFIRLESLFTKLLITNYLTLDNNGYLSMRKLYLEIVKSILQRESDILNKLIAASSKNTSKPYKKDVK